MFVTMDTGRDEFVETVRSRSDIVDVISVDVELKHASRNYIGLCPFHDERTPSFNVSVERQMYYCFGCQAGGDVFRYIMDTRQLDFRAALEFLAQRAGLAMPAEQLSPAARRLREQKTQLRTVNEAAARWFEEALRAPDAQGARHYLQQRGMAGTAARDFRVGWSPSAWDTLSRSLAPRFGTELLVKAGLVTPSNRGDGFYDRFRGRIMFPITDEGNRVIGFGGRLLAPAADQAKYLNSPETMLFKKRAGLYALGRALTDIRRADRVLVVEGYTDAIACHQYGFNYAVASLGTALSAEQAALLVRYSRHVLIAYDADGAGQAAALRGLAQFRALGDVDVRVVDLSAGTDPDSFLRHHGAEAFQKRLDRALPLLDWRFVLACRRHDQMTVAGKVEIVNEVAPLLAEMDNAVAQAAYVESFAQRLMVPMEALWREVRRRRPSPTGRPDRPQSRRLGPGGHKTSDGRDNNSAANGRSDQYRLRRHPERFGGAEGALLHTLLHHPEAGATVWQQLTPDDFILPAHREIAAILVELTADAMGHEMKDRKSLGYTVMDSVTVPAVRNLVAGLLMAERQLPGSPQEVATQLIHAMRRDAMDNQRRSVAAEIRRLEGQGEAVPVQLVRLHGELDRRYRELQGVPGL